MKKRSRVFALLVLLAMMLLIPGPVDSYGAEYYNTNQYNVTMDVAEDNSFVMTEEINVTYTEPRHGLYRYIPLSGTAYSQVDGQTVEQKYRMKVENVRVDGYEYQTFEENGNIHVGLTIPGTACCTNVIISGLANVIISVFFS